MWIVSESVDLSSTLSDLGQGAYLLRAETEAGADGPWVEVRFSATRMMECKARLPSGEELDSYGLEGRLGEQIGMLLITLKGLEQEEFYFTSMADLELGEATSKARFPASA